MGLLDFHSIYKILFAVHLKHSSFWPSADVKHASNDVVHEATWQCMFALSVCIQPPLYFHLLY